jgi:hypothetical protein
MRNLLLIAVTGIVAIGCSSQDRTGSDPVYPVTGVITYRGKPVVQGDVTFFNAEKNRSAFGKTNDKGEYKLTTFTLNDGAVEGQHVVTVMKLETPMETAPAAALESEAYVPPGVGQSTQPKPPKSDLPEKYANQSTSGLTATVKADGPNVVNLDLE